MSENILEKSEYKICRFLVEGEGCEDRVRGARGDSGKPLREEGVQPTSPTTSTTASTITSPTTSRLT